MSYNRILIRRGMSSDLATVVLALGEPCLAIDTMKLYIGDGVTPGGIEVSPELTLAVVAFTGDYSDLNNKPTIPAPQVNADWNSTSGLSRILNKPEIPPPQVKADWEATSGLAEILNKPEIIEEALTDGKTYGRKDAEWVEISSGGGHVIQDEGTPLAARANLNFVGSGVTVTDDSVNNRTVVTIPSSGGSFDIDDLTEATAVEDTDFVAVSVSGEMRKVALSVIKAGMAAAVILFGAETYLNQSILDSPNNMYQGDLP